MELIVLNTTTQEIPADTASIVAVPAGVQKVLIKTIRVTSDNAADTFEVEILTAETDGRVEYASLPASGELYDVLDLPYVCTTESNNIYLRIKPTAAMSFTIEIMALKLK